MKRITVGSIRARDPGEQVFVVMARQIADKVRAAANNEAAHVGTRKGVAASKLCDELADDMIELAEELAEPKRVSALLTKLRKAANAEATHAGTAKGDAAARKADDAIAAIRAAFGGA